MMIQQVLHRIDNGDVVLFEGTGPAAWLVRMRTRSRYAHVGIVAIDHHEDPWLVEACWPTVRMVPLHRRLAEAAAAGDVAHWFGLDRHAVDGPLAAGFAVAQVGRRYASLAQFLVSFGLLTRLRRWWQGLGPADVDPERWFCSELVMAALQHGGWQLDTGEDWIAAATEPGRIATFRCLHRWGTLEI